MTTSCAVLGGLPAHCVRCVAAPRRAREEIGVVGERSGSVTFVQRFGDSINLHTHFHAIALDGVYADPEDTGTPRSFALSPVSDEEIARVTATAAKWVVALLIRRGLLVEDGPVAADPLAEEEPSLATCAQASVGHRIGTGLRAGKRVMRLGASSSDSRPFRPEEFYSRGSFSGGDVSLSGQGAFPPLGNKRGKIRSPRWDHGRGK